MWKLVYALSEIKVVDELNGDNIHSLLNGLTLSVHVHDLFDNLNAWFEEDEASDYTLRWF